MKMEFLPALSEIRQMLGEDLYVKFVWMWREQEQDTRGVERRALYASVDAPAHCRSLAHTGLLAHRRARNAHSRASLSGCDRARPQGRRIDRSGRARRLPRSHRRRRPRRAARSGHGRPPQTAVKDSLPERAWRAASRITHLPIARMRDHLISPWPAAGPAIQPTRVCATHDSARVARIASSLADPRFRGGRRSRLDGRDKALPW
jgi:hypothetical protein